MDLETQSLDLINFRSWNSLRWSWKSDFQSAAVLVPERYPRHGEFDWFATATVENSADPERLKGPKCNRIRNGRSILRKSNDNRSTWKQTIKTNLIELLGPNFGDMDPFGKLSKENYQFGAVQDIAKGGGRHFTKSNLQLAVWRSALLERAHRQFLKETFFYWMRDRDKQISGLSSS